MTEKNSTKKKGKPKYDYPTYSGSKLPRISYPIELHKRLVAIAKRKKVTLTKLYAQALSEFVERH